LKEEFALKLNPPPLDVEPLSALKLGVCEGGKPNEGVGAGADVAPKEKPAPLELVLDPPPEEKPPPNEPPLPPPKEVVLADPKEPPEEKELEAPMLKPPGLAGASPIPWSDDPPKAASLLTTLS